MQSSTSNQRPSQAQSTKRRKTVPMLDLKTLETIVSFWDMLADMNSDDPVVRSHAVQSLTTLSPIMYA